MTDSHGKNSTTIDGEDIIITRTFNAPHAKVWQAFTDPNYLKRWWGPKNFTAPVVNMDFRVGGKCHSCMRSAEGQDFWSIGEYREIVPMEKIVCTDSFADKDGNVIPASQYGMGDDWPELLLVTQTFADDGGKTKFTLRHEGIPAAMQEMCAAGWNESFDKLDDVLAGK